MVVGTDIEDRMVLTVIPTDDFIVFFDKREEAVGRLAHLAPALDLGEQPTARNDGMRLEQFDGGCCLHLAGDDTREVILHRQVVDGTYFVGLHDESERPQECLHLLPFPMEIHTDGDIMKRERSVGRFRRERQFTVLVVAPQDAALTELHLLLSLYGLALCDVGLIERELDFPSTDDAHGHHRFVVHDWQGRLFGVFDHQIDKGFHVVVAYRHLLEDADGCRGVHPFKIALTRRDNQSGHVESTGTHHHLAVVVGTITVRSVFPSWENDAKQFIALAPSHDIEHGFLALLSFGIGHGLVESAIELAEQLFAALLVATTHKQGMARIVGQ